MTSLALLIRKRKNVSCLGVQDGFPLNSFFIFFFFFFELLVFFGAEITSKFNKEMYKKIKEKKNEPLSSIGQKKLRFTDKEKEKEKEKEMVERGSSTPILELVDGQEASPGISVEEVARPFKRQKLGSKGKEKVGSSVWSNAEVAVDRANEFFTLGEMKEISSTPSHEMVNRHIHKLVQVILPAFVVPLFFFFC